MYMNCAVVTISNSASKRSAIPSPEPLEPLENEGPYINVNGTLKKRALGNTQIFLANIGNGCTTASGTDVVFPNPGDDVVYDGNAAERAAPSGSCGSGSYTGGGAVGDGNFGGSSSDGPVMFVPPDSTPPSSSPSYVPPSTIPPTTPSSPSDSSSSSPPPTTPEIEIGPYVGGNGGSQFDVPTDDETYDPLCFAPRFVLVIFNYHLISGE